MFTSLTFDDDHLSSRTNGQGNCLIKRLPSLSTITWPNIWPSGIRFFNNWRMLTANICIVRQKRLQSVSCYLVTFRVLPCHILHCLHGWKCQHHPNRIHFASALGKNSPRCEHVLTKHLWRSSALQMLLWQVDLRLPNVLSRPIGICLLSI